MNNNVNEGLETREVPNVVIKVSKAIGLSLIPCNSSNILAFAHIHRQKRLYILFKNKTLYRYENQDYNAFISLLNAESKGKWVRKHLIEPIPKVNFSKWYIEGA